MSVCVRHHMRRAFLRKSTYLSLLHQESRARNQEMVDLDWLVHMPATFSKFCVVHHLLAS